MKKIPTVFVRDPHQRAHVTDQITPGCEWVALGEGRATRKYDGTCVMLDAAGEWWARREVKPRRLEPAGYQLVELDPVTGKKVGWERIEQSPFHAFFNEALEPLLGFASLIGRDLAPGTFELIGPKINGNPENAGAYRLEPHANAELIDWDDDRGLPFHESMRDCMNWLDAQGIEGLVWHHPDGRMAKLKVRDYPRP